MKRDVGAEPTAAKVERAWRERSCVLRAREAHGDSLHQRSQNQLRPTDERLREGDHRVTLATRGVLARVDLGDDPVPERQQDGAARKLQQRVRLDAPPHR